MGDSRPVGLFDSGVGGLTVVREVFSLLPQEKIVYYGDNAHVPYGPRKLKELVGFADRILSFMVEQDVKYVIFACNTNSSLTLGIVRERYPVPMIGLVEPGARDAVRVTANRRVGVVATEATINSGAYEKAIREMDSRVQVFSRAAPKLVPLVEAGKAGTMEAFEAVFCCLAPLKEQNVDTVIFGCTHYPFLTSEFRDVLGPGVNLVDPAVATVLSAAKDMENKGLLNDSGPATEHLYYVSGDPEPLQEAALNFLGYTIPPVQKVELS